MVGLSDDAANSASGNFAENMELLCREFPHLHARLDEERVSVWRAQLAEGSSWGRDDFGSEKRGGRGDSYVRAQAENVYARATGIRQLLGLMQRKPDGQTTIVDLLGGDGLVRRVCDILELPGLEIITCDASPHMVRAAWEMGIPALLQRAEQQLFRSGSLDGVLLAYGTHHIEPGTRGAVAKEAHRVLGPGGTFVLHDFLIGSPVDTWFAEVVDPFSRTGHPYVHFTADEIHGSLLKAGFDGCELLEIDDPYSAIASTPEEAELRLGEYLVNMYGLSKAREMFGDRKAFRWAIYQAKRIFRHPDGAETTIVQETGSGSWRVTVPRVAIVGVGRKL